MMFDTDFDKQKLMFHPTELAAWLSGGKTKGPLYTELELSNRCNCKCLFCGVDHQVNKTAETMGLGLAETIIDGLAGLGNKSLMLCGNGEPLLNPYVAEIVEYAAGRMSVSMTTNGLAFSPQKIPLIDHLEWIRFSVNGYDPDNYSSIQGATPGSFQKVLGNIELAVARKREYNLPVTIGTQLVLLPENRPGIIDLARKMRDMEVNYFSIKPYSQHPLSNNRLEIDYSAYLELEDELKQLENKTFKIIFRSAAMSMAGSSKTYSHCYGTHFISFISSNGDVWECNVFAGDKRFYVGNANTESISDIWGGERRKEIVRFIEDDLNLDECRDLCRMDACNKYLWRLRNPWPHDNFI